MKYYDSIENGKLCVIPKPHKNEMDQFQTFVRKARRFSEEKISNENLLFKDFWKTAFDTYTMKSPDVFAPETVLVFYEKTGEKQLSDRRFSKFRFAASFRLSVDGKNTIHIKDGPKDSLILDDIYLPLD